jgi:hypothetical protein
MVRGDEQHIATTGVRLGVKHPEARKLRSEVVICSVQV